MKNKILVLTVASLLGGNFAACAQQSPKPYAYWPDTDTEWNRLTNHITWCFESLRVRRYVATGEMSGTNEWSPSLVCPYRDYLKIARQIDELAPYFVNHSLAENGDFASYFQSTNNAEGCCPSDFPSWTPERLHSQAFGRTSWSTNVALTAWMAVTNRAIVSEVTAAIHLLQWTPSYHLGCWLADGWQGWLRDGSSFKDTCANNQIMSQVS